MIAGIDLGGTNVRIGVINELLEIVEWKEALSEVEKGYDHTIQVIFNLLDQVKADYHIERVGLCAPGPLDHKAGVLLDPPNLKGWGYQPIVQSIERYMSCPVYLLNDANAAALSEAATGAGEGYESVWFTTVSTGIGSGYVYQGKLIQGEKGCTGEIGNMIIVPGGYRHANLNPGSLEGYASGTAIGRIAKEKYGIKGGAFEVIDRAQKGDPQATIILNSTLEYLSTAIANIVHTINPSVFVFGGGVMTDSEYLLPLLSEKVDQRIYGSLQGTIELKAAHHKNEAGVLGAAVYASQQPSQPSIVRGLKS
ncbi:ROK family protein [Jeotgalibacillus haloalkalitolerans]|uniref:ROK family protein n=1 Tax=Jeotgalibacillus haloalkalitolerans TaxID=3104292 RepID=A0ABU5KJI9_9BACL|nr:ROK family protein [Jeotgalibacillus sp. HH7-29]MDZ5711427.1 ROK family protein [Jeotgalibacillus sp. HH7-29]